MWDDSILLPHGLPLQRRTISWRAPMVPSMASSNRAFMSWDFLNVRLFILSRVFLPYNIHEPLQDKWKQKSNNNKIIAFYLLLASDIL